MSGLLWDMHVHLDFMLHPREIAREAEAIGLGLFDVTVEPRDYESAAAVLADAPNVRVGVGLHPWWIADGRCGQADVDRAAGLLRRARFAGEIGLDASEKHVPLDSLDRQEACLEQLCRACAETSIPESPKILSLHTVKAGKRTLDILERTGCLDRCRCIFHWFTGSGEDLNRAVRAGCMFSVNGMMLRTRRGRDYARQLPPDRLLVETDLPPGRDVPFSAAMILAELEKTLDTLKDIRGADMGAIIRENSEKLLGEG